MLSYMKEEEGSFAFIASSCTLLAELLVLVLLKQILLTEKAAVPDISLMWVQLGK